MDTYTITENWKDAIGTAKLETLTLLLMYTEGTCLSMHSRGSTFRSVLPCGQTVFIKRDHFTMKKDMLPELLHFRLPVPKSIREWRIFDRLRGMGFITPEVIAGGYRRSMGLPTAGGIVMLPLDGIPLDRFLASEHDESRQTEAIGKCRSVLDRLHDCGVSWPDSKAEHFILRPDGSVGLIDLERAQFHSSPLTENVRAPQVRRFQRTASEAINGRQ